MIGDVAEALRGEPSSRTGRELRFGRRGSLSVRLDTGTWFDHEAGAGGGTLDLVRHVLGCDRGAALDWLAGAGFVERGSGSAARAAPESPGSCSQNPQWRSYMIRSRNEAAHFGTRRPEVRSLITRNSLIHLSRARLGEPPPTRIRSR